MLRVNGKYLSKRSARCKGDQLPRRIRRSGGLWSSVRELSRSSHAPRRKEIFLDWN
jgi:hypothetical protein